MGCYTAWALKAAKNPNTAKYYKRKKGSMRICKIKIDFFNWLICKEKKTLSLEHVNKQCIQYENSKDRH